MINLNEKLREVAVIGAGGKMGRGIALLLLREVLLNDLKLNETTTAKVHFIDNSSTGLAALRIYLDEQLLKFAERNIIQLRQLYKNQTQLVDNSEIIQQFISDSHRRIHTSTDITCLGNCHMVFEAIFEDIKIKNELYSKLKNVCADSCLYFSNTSSIPISVIDQANNLNGRIVGFHFYNPPAIQKLLELIFTGSNSEDFKKISHELAVRLGKTVVISNDIAGFIGNGHFIREGLFSLNQMENLPHLHSTAILLLDTITRDYLLRPMGIFQLIDYVGLDVFKMICSSMDAHLVEEINSPIIDVYLALGIRGGQNHKGEQMDGFFSYDKGRISAVYCDKSRSYIPCGNLQEEIDDIIKSTITFQSWKELSRHEDRNTVIKKYFDILQYSEDKAAHMAMTFINESKRICIDLVKGEVAENIEDVNTVLKLGFYHLYAPGEVL